MYFQTATLIETHSSADGDAEVFRWNKHVLITS